MFSQVISSEAARCFPVHAHSCNERVEQPRMKVNICRLSKVFLKFKQILFSLSTASKLFVDEENVWSQLPNWESERKMLILFDLCENFSLKRKFRLKYIQFFFLINCQKRNEDGRKSCSDAI